MPESFEKRDSKFSGVSGMASASGKRKNERGANASASKGFSKPGLPLKRILKFGFTSDIHRVVFVVDFHSLWCMITLRGVFRLSFNRRLAASRQRHRGSSILQWKHRIAWCFRVPIFFLAMGSTKVLGNTTMKNLESTEVAILAGGCFWGVEELFRAQLGVLDTEVGYTGGSLPRPTYEDVKKGTTGHAEAIRVVFDPKITSFENILGYFFKIHDPTTLNKQGNDVGSQYRSAIFYSSPSQKTIAEKLIEKINSKKVWGRPIVTQIEKAGTFYPAEGYHQDYLQKNPNGYTCHFERKITI
jgi:peptide-methionine (S)-S-oxide reductase